MRAWLLRPAWRALRLFGLWVLPPLVMALLLAVGFAWWCFSSQPGTRWLLRTAVAQFDGQVQDIRGSLARGLSVGDLRLTVAENQVRVRDLHLDVRWSELRGRRLHVADLSASGVSVQARTPPEQTQSSAPFRFPALPLSIQVDRLALGAVDVRIDGQPLPVTVGSLATSLSLDARGATLALDQLQLARDDMQVTLHGNADLRGLAAPWPLEVDLQASAQGRGEHSPICLRQLSGQAPSKGEEPCRIQLRTQVAGTLDALRIRASGSGEGLRLAADALVHPSEAFPLGETHLDLGLPGDASLRLEVTPRAPAADGSRAIQVQWAARHVQPGPWLPKAVGSTLLNLQGNLQVGLTASQQIRDLALRLDLDGPNRWNGAPLSGHVKITRLGRAQGVLFDPAASAPWDPLGLVVSGLDMALVLGPDHIEGKGDLSADASHLSLQARLPALKALWPGLPGGGTLALETQGSLARHQGDVKLRYTPADSQAGVPGKAPLSLDLAVSGTWSADQGWRGSVTRVDVQHAGLAVRSIGAVPVSITPAGAWQVGHATIAASLDGESLLRIDQQSSSGSAGQWATRGAIPSLTVTPERILKLQQWLGRGAQEGGVRTALSDRARRSRLDARVDWNLTFKNALSGDIHVARTSGDLIVPGDVPITLGLRAASLDLAIRPTRGSTSLARADLQIQTAKMGSLRVQADSPLHATPSGGIVLQPHDVKHVQVQADSDDLAWVNLLLDGSLEVGGTVHADVRGQSRPDGRWTFSGPVRGENLSILSVDQGIRLLQGTLAAHLDGSRAVLDSLRFPAVRRVTPKEWRTATWISENPDAQNGSLDLSGGWDLYQEQGQVRIAFRRYPILQRADRYAMISGDIAIQATLPKIGVTGKIVADAGWFDLDMLNNIPSLDGDVVVLQPGKKTAEPEPSTPLDLSVDLNVDLGPRFYLTGYGVNSGLTGSMDLRMRQGKLTALGALHTRGGSIDVYGQHLQLRRGTVTFQGDIANPVLSIEALRTDVAVQAGVRVAGTARRPRIDLVSYPDVSETEKLTWLILGHGPDDGGGDVSLLFSVGSSFLSGGEPFYKRFGLDELSMRSGELGSTGSILPVQSVVTDLDTGASPAEQRFAVASKTLTDNLRVSLEQALAQTGTVARLSYRVMRRLQAEVTVGTVNGLALVYRWFSMD